MSSSPSRRLPPTLEEVAAAAGVSRSTVSRVVNGSTRVSAEVLENVTRAIDELRYVPNRVARSLANRQTMAIALVVPEETTRFFGDPYFASIVDGIASALQPSDYVLNLQFASPGAPSEKTVRYLLGGNVDGAIVVSHHSGNHFLASLSHSLPVVFGGRPLHPDEQPSYYVDVDNVAAAEMGTRYLIDQGRQRIATITGSSDMPAGIDREAGWQRAMDRAGLRTDLVARGDFSMASGARCMRALLDRAPGLDAVFVASDLMATGAVSVLRERGRAIPSDVAVVGFDDSPAAIGGEVDLTTVFQPSVEMGEAMAHMLVGLLRGEEPGPVTIMPTRMVVRESA
ncbi:LacI family DNA-binding transcriptional regulator [Conyzicola sp.]|uniref:LacI family DNA-binding transcriptional regulator n=1 Tax=Conyzicola sp. TaxID=1969404 RepID=UPI003988EF5A